MCPDGFMCNGYAVVLCMMLCLFSRIMKNVISSLFGAGCLGVKRMAIAIALGGAAGVLPAQEQAEPAQKPWQLQCVTLIRKGDDESLARAVELVRKEAEAGDATAQTVLGLRYIVGAGVEKKQEEAERYLKKAAEQNSRDARWLLGYCCSNREEADKYTQAAAEDGHCGAQCKMGELCSSAVGSMKEKDPDGAFRWYSMAAEQKENMGLAGLGTCYCLGIGVEKDEKKGYALSEQAAELGNIHAMEYHALFPGVQWNPASRGQMQVKDAKGRQLLFAEAGSQGAMCNLSNCYMSGWGVPKDENAALYWRIKAVEKGDAFMTRDMVALSMPGDLESAVQKGDPLAMFLKGFLLQMENRLNDKPDNMEEIISLYQKAAEKKLSHAQYRLALCYEMGLGVEANVPEAVKWYRKAAEQGHAEAQYRLARCFEKLGKGKQLKELAKWYAKAAKQGHARAQYQLGLCFLHAKGGVDKKDAKAAAKWFRMAADRFDIGGLYEMGMLYYSGKGVKKDRKEALRFLSIAGESFGPLCLEIDRFRKPTKASGYAEECIEQMSRANADALSILYLLRSLKK